MENDGLMGGLNTFPRNFSLSDLSMDLHAQTSDGDQVKLNKSQHKD